METLVAMIVCIAVVLFGIGLVVRKGSSSLGQSRQISPEEIEEIMQKEPEERTLPENMILKMHEAQSKQKSSE